MSKASPLNPGDWLSLLDFDAIALPSDKLDECRYFFGLLKKETDSQRFRWLISAFFGAAYSYFEILALHAHLSFSDPNSGESIPDEEALEILRRYVRIVQDAKNPAYVKTSGLHPITKQLYELRRKNTHHTPLSIMKTQGEAPEGFQFGHLAGSGTPALPFCKEVMELLEDVHNRLEPHVI